MWEAILRWAATIDWVQLLTLLFAGGAGYVGLGGKVPSKVPFVGGSSEPDMHAELDALMLLRKRAERSKSAKLLKAVAELESVFFDQGQAE